MYVFDSPQTSSCTCPAFAMHGQCEHSLFVDSLALPGRPPRLSLETLPYASRARGRKRGADPGPRAQKAQVARDRKQARRLHRVLVSSSLHATHTFCPCQVIFFDAALAVVRKCCRFADFSSTQPTDIPFCGNAFCTLTPVTTFQCSTIFDMYTRLLLSLTCCNARYNALCISISFLSYI